MYDRRVRLAASPNSPDAANVWAKVQTGDGKITAPPEVKKRLKEFRRDLDKFLQKGENKEQVYCLAQQFFSLESLKSKGRENEN